MRFEKCRKCLTCSQPNGLYSINEFLVLLFSKNKILQALASNFISKTHVVIIKANRLNDDNTVIEIRIINVYFCGWVFYKKCEIKSTIYFYFFIFKLCYSAICHRYFIRSLIRTTLKNTFSQTVYTIFDFPEFESSPIGFYNNTVFFDKFCTKPVYKFIFTIKTSAQLQLSRGFKLVQLKQKYNFNIETFSIIGTTKTR